MVNYVSLGAGLRQVGDIAGNVSQFMQTERQLDQGDRRLGQADRELDMRREMQDHTLRQQKNQEYGRQLMGVINEASQSAKPDGTKFKDLGEYLDSDVGAAARDRLTGALADSNSQFRAKLKGAPVRSVRDETGRFVVQAKKGDAWEPVTGEDGAPVSFSGAELAHKARLDAASAGVAELIYFKRQAKAALASGQLSQAEYDTQVSQIDGQAAELLDRADASGLPRDQVIETSRQGDPRNWAKEVPVQEETSRLGGALKTAIPTGARVAEVAGPVAGGLAGLGSFAREMFRKPEGAREEYVTIPEPTAPVIPNNMGMASFDPARASQAQSPVESQPGSAQAQPPKAVPEWAAPLGPDADKVVTPTEQNTRPVQQEARTNRAIDVLTRVSAPDASAADSRDAALQYANASTIMGQQPNAQILANLYAGDDMRGSAAEAAAQELQYYKAALKKGATGTQDFANTLKLREQIYKEQNRAAEMAAEAAIPAAPGGMKGASAERTAKVKQLQNAIQLGMSTSNNDLKALGVDTTQLMGSMATLPMVADLLAKYYVEDMGAARHNAQGAKVFSPSTWLSTKRERTTVMNKVLKEVSVVDPVGFRRQVYLGLVANREPGMAADDPKLIEAARKTIEYYEKMETPVHGYDAATSQ